jgi:predicted lipid-binding transport protein (Tim44 family)
VDPILRNQASIDIIQTSDENFSEEDFLAWVREVFVALNVAWTARDWTSIRVFEDDNLFREHEMQLEDYIRRNQINQIERLGITEAAITDHDLDANREYVTVKVRAHMVDYVIDERTKAVVSGDSSRVVHMQYTLKFMRTLGTKTLGNLREIGVTNCPNCGAPTKLTAAGQCEYCKTIITSGTYNWMLVSYTGVHAD